MEKGGPSGKNPYLGMPSSYVEVIDTIFNYQNQNSTILKDTPFFGLTFEQRKSLVDLLNHMLQIKRDNRFSIRQVVLHPFWSLFSLTLENMYAMRDAYLENDYLYLKQIDEKFIKPDLFKINRKEKKLDSIPKSIKSIPLKENFKVKFSIAESSFILSSFRSRTIFSLLFSDTFLLWNPFTFFASVHLFDRVSKQLIYYVLNTVVEDSIKWVDKIEARLFSMCLLLMACSQIVSKLMESYYESSPLDWIGKISCQEKRFKKNFKLKQSKIQNWLTEIEWMICEITHGQLIDISDEILKLDYDKAKVTKAAFLAFLYQPNPSKALIDRIKNNLDLFQENGYFYKKLTLSQYTEHIVKYKRHDSFNYESDSSSATFKKEYYTYSMFEYMYVKEPIFNEPLAVHIVNDPLRKGYKAFSFIESDPFPTQEWSLIKKEIEKSLQKK